MDHLDKLDNLNNSIKSKPLNLKLISELVNDCIKSNINLNIYFPDKNHTLFFDLYIIFYNKNNIIKKIIERKIFDINEPVRKCGRNFLMILLDNFESNEDLINLVIKNGADVNLQLQTKLIMYPSNEYTPLGCDIFEIRKMHIPIVDILECDTWLTNFNKSDDVNMIYNKFRFLVKNGANINIYFDILKVNTNSTYDKFRIFDEEFKKQQSDTIRISLLEYVCKFDKLRKVKDFLNNVIVHVCVRHNYLFLFRF